MESLELAPVYATFGGPGDDYGPTGPPTHLRTGDGVVYMVEWIRRVRPIETDSAGSQAQLAVEVNAYSEAADLSLTLILALPARDDNPSLPDWEALRPVRPQTPSPTASEPKGHAPVRHEPLRIGERLKAMDDPSDNSWRRCRCLGCGTAIVRARDPHQYVGGTLRGAGIITWPTGPDKAESYGPPPHGEEGRYLLGIVHVGCLNQAIHRVEHGNIEYEYELRHLDVETYPAYRYSLHRPAPDEVCPFCNSRAELTNEHIWPWIHEMIEDMATIQERLRFLDKNSKVQ